MIKPDIDKFRKMADRGNLIAVSREILADIDTPVSTFLKTADNAGYAFLFESTESEKNLGRYSFIGIDPLLIFEAKDTEVSIQRDGSGKETFTSTDPIKDFQNLLSDYKLVGDEPVLPFTGGAVGFIGYGMVRFFDNIEQNAPREMDYPDMQFLIPKTVIVFDHFNHRMKIVSVTYVRDKSAADAAYAEALRRIGAATETFYRSAGLKPVESAPKNRAKLEYTSNCTKEEFKDMVSRAKDYIRAGDIIQVVLSQRLKVKTAARPFDIYRALRSVNPSPYMFYIRFGENTLVGSSPEVFVKNDGGRVTIRPIAGTRPRGADLEEDEAMEKDLLADEKEKAEHVMLVDLARNDIGRVCEMGSVKLNEFMSVERYSHVMHIVSNVVGRLAGDKNAFELMASCFPAGTVSGAPKIRAMQIIEELETAHRGPYAGTVGYFSLSGDFDSCITIRTLYVKGDTVYIQAGAGIVFDSDPEKEYEETLNKARGMLRAIELAQSFSEKGGAE